MAAPAGTTVEIRPTVGSATAGGGFVNGGTGTDFSQQAAPQIAVTDAVANGTTTVTSATANFASTHVDNLIYLAGGTGTLAGTRRRVVSVTNATTIVVDATVATGTGITLNLGGALDSVATFIGATSGFVAGNHAWLKNSGVDSVGALTCAFSINPPTTTTPPTRITGYNAVRGDINKVTDTGRPTIRATGAVGSPLLAFTGTGFVIEGVILDGNAKSNQGLALGADYHIARNCKVMGATSIGIVISQSTSRVVDCEVTGTITGGNSGINSNGSVEGCYVHDNATVGIINNGLRVRDCVVVNNTGATSDGIQTGTHNSEVVRNTVYGNGRHGQNLTSSLYIFALCRSNIFANNGGYGFASTTNFPADPMFDGNFYFGNTSGTRNNLDNVSGIFATNPYVNQYDVILTASPFTNAATGDFTLNNTAGGGAAVRAAGFPREFLGLGVRGYADGGALQHQDLGSGGVTKLAGFGGGLVG
jgi:hypothetical protein